MEVVRTNMVLPAVFSRFKGKNSNNKWGAHSQDQNQQGQFSILLFTHFGQITDSLLV